MYLHLGQPSEFNSAQLPSFLHCPPFFGCWKARTPKAQSKIFVVCCSADVGDHRWCGKDGGQEIGKAWLMPAMDAMMTKPNPGCWEVNPCHWLTMTQSLDRSVNEKQIFDNNDDCGGSITLRYDDVDVVGADITSINWSCNHWFVLVLIFWQRSVREQSNSFEKKCKKDHFVCLLEF